MTDVAPVGADNACRKCGVKEAGGIYSASLLFHSHVARSCRQLPHVVFDVREHASSLPSLHHVLNYSYASQPLNAGKFTASMSSHVTNGDSSELRYIDLTYDHNDWERTAKELAYQIDPSWREHPEQIQLVHFKEGITNTVRTSLWQGTCSH